MMNRRIVILLAALLAMTFALGSLAAAERVAFNGHSATGVYTVLKKSALSIKKVEYDAEDHELEIDFSGRVQYKKPKVVVKDASGKRYAARIREKDRDDMEVYVKGLVYGRTYTVTVSGVRLRGKGKYTKVSKTFVAIDD